MKLGQIICIAFLLQIFSTSVFSQEKLNVKYGKVTPQDFTVKNPVVDSSTEAVVIADVGSSEFVGNRKAGFSIVFKRFTRILILDKKGIDAATVEIPLYVSGTREEKIENLKGHTYNLENGNIVETKLENESIFKEKRSKKISVRKFTMPAVKPGSIIEYTYTLQSDFIFNLQPWEFQGEYPRLWSEYQVEIPEYFRYLYLSQGSKDFFVKKSDTEKRKWYITFGANSTEASQTESLEGYATIDKWVMKELPALKEEPYTSTIDNHISKIEFQLASVQYPNQPLDLVMNSWDKAMTELMQSEDFGNTLNHPNNWLDDDLKVITKGATTATDKAKLIYQYVKNNFTATSRYGLFLNDNIKTIFKNKHGNVAEINLLLITMLLHENIKAYPVILSTKNHGYTSELYPILDKYNYVICYAEIDKKEVLLDASNPALGFGQLHWKCYNGQCRIVDPKNPSPVLLDADSLKEKKFTMITIGNDDKTGWGGNLASTCGMYESITIKDQVADKGQDEYFKKLRSAYTYDLKMYNQGIDSLKKDGEPVNVHYDFDIPVNKEDDIIYLNPLMGEGFKENPFKSANRKYPVEMPYASDVTIVANIDAPQGYVVDEIPKSAKVNYNEDEGLFEYIIAKTSEETVQLRCRIKIGKANFKPEEYQTLRDFYAYIVKKQAEPVVFKKKP